MDTLTQQGDTRTPPASKAFIYYWKNYRKDADEDSLPLFRLHQNSKTMEHIHRGDIVWAFTRRTDRAYVIVARFLVSDAGKTPIPTPTGDGGSSRATGWA